MGRESWDSGIAEWVEHYGIAGCIESHGIVEWVEHYGIAEWVEPYGIVECVENGARARNHLFKS